MSTAAIITAAGRGLRAGGDLPKQWQHIGGKPVLLHTVERFRQSGLFSTIVVTIHPDDHTESQSLGAGVTLIEGGDTRKKSVGNALEHLENRNISKVFIHDGARPFPSNTLLNALHQTLENKPAAAPALAITDALWRGEGGKVAGVQDRSGLFRAQTPQAFHFAAILAAHRAHSNDAADDVEVARAAGLEVAIVAGEEDNIKITLPGDFARAEKILAERILATQTKILAGKEGWHDGRSARQRF